VLNKYQEIAARESGRVAVIEGDGSIDEVREQIAKLTEKRLRLRASHEKGRP
jgi:thymidylate kinase